MNLEAKIIKPKLGLLELSRQLGSVTQACKVFGYSRDSFYRFKKLYEEGGELALRDIVRLNRPNPKNRVDPEIESRVVKIALDNPALGQQRVSNELRKEGLFISHWIIQPWDSREFPTNCVRKDCLFLQEASDQFGSVMILKLFKSV